MRGFDIDEDSLSKRSLRNFSLVLAVASFLNFWRWSLLGTFSDLASLWLYPAIAGLLGAGSLFFWPRMRVLWSSVLFWFIFLLSLVVNAATTLVLSKSFIEFAPFGGFKITALVLAVLAPQPILNGYLAVSLCGIVPTVMYYTWLEDYQFRLSVQEPALTIVTVVVSLMILFYRIRNIRLDYAYAKVVAEKENLQELTHIFLALRDLTNTPLQIISLTASLLEKNEIESAKAAEHLKTAVDRLAKVGETLSQEEGFERLALTPPSFYDSPDPIEYLQKKLKAFRDKSK